MIFICECMIDSTINLGRDVVTYGRIGTINTWMLKLIESLTYIFSYDHVSILYYNKPA